MRRIMLLTWICAMVLGVGVFPRVVTAAPGGPSGVVLYQWKLPSSGHIGAWRISHAVVRYGGASNGAVFPHFTVPAGRDIAVQAQIRGDGPGGPDVVLQGFGLVARRTSTDVQTSIAGGSFFSSQNAREDTNPEIYWNGQTVGGAAFQPGKQWHLYRLEIRGDRYALLIDGKQMVNYTIDDYPNPTRVGVFSRFYRIEVRQFEVLSLPAAAVGQVSVVPSLSAINLTVSDLPPTGFYLPTLRHWYPNEEVARERLVSPVALDAEGRIVAYGVDFFALSRDVSDIYSNVSVYGTAAGARTDLAARLAVLRRDLPHLVTAPVTNYHDLTGLNVGDVSDGFRFDATSSGINARFIFLYFTRGRYECNITLAIDPSSAPDAAQNVALAVDLARIVDGRMPGAG